MECFYILREGKVGIGSKCGKHTKKIGLCETHYYYLTFKYGAVDQQTDDILIEMCRSNELKLIIRYLTMYCNIPQNIISARINNAIIKSLHFDSIPLIYGDRIKIISYFLRYKDYFPMDFNYNFLDGIKTPSSDRVRYEIILKRWMIKQCIVQNDLLDILPRIWTLN